MKTHTTSHNAYTHNPCAIATHLVHKRLGVLLLFLLPWLTALGQSPAYERYSTRENLEVAYLENLPIDSTHTVNATFLIAQDSTTWHWLQDTFHIPLQSDTQGNIQKGYLRLCDPQHPENLSPDPNSPNLLWANANQQTILIIDPKDKEQFQLLVKYIVKQINKW